MTVDELDEYRLNLLWQYGDIAHKMANKMNLNTYWRGDMFLLSVLGGYIDIMLEYTLQTESDYDSGDGNINFLTVEDMLDVQFRINSILSTDFNYDFILDE